MTRLTRTSTAVPVLRERRKGLPWERSFRPEAMAAYESLSARELDVLRLLVKGLTNAEIARTLGISIETVRKHVSNALEKTGTKTRAGLVGRALGRSGT